MSEKQALSHLQNVVFELPLFIVALCISMASMLMSKLADEVDLHIVMFEADVVKNVSK